MGKPFDQLKINPKKLTKASGMDCNEELQAFFACMTVSGHMRPSCAWQAW
jgi:hypothetical protein